MEKTDLICKPPVPGVTRREFLCMAAAGLALALPVVAGAAEMRKKDQLSGTVTILEFSNDGKPKGAIQVERIVKTEDEWRKQLPRESFEITRHAGTERPYTGKYWNLHSKGIYRCICCDTPLFDSATKYESGTGWPSYWKPIAEANIEKTNDYGLGIPRVAVSCKRCGAHLGHVFDDGPPPTGLRYCMNSGALRFVGADAT